MAPMCIEVNYILSRNYEGPMKERAMAYRPYREAPKVPGSDEAFGEEGLGTCHGRAVQADPIKPTLKALGIKLLKLRYEELLSKIAFKFNLRRYTMAARAAATAARSPAARSPAAEFPATRSPAAASPAGAYTRSHFSST